MGNGSHTGHVSTGAWVVAALVVAGLPACDGQGQRPGGRQDLSVFQECAECPQMVVIPAGSFQMGSERGEEDETPVHRVAVPRFAMGKHEVTFEEWDACVAAGGCTHRPDDEGSGRGKRPVMNVDWNEIQEYARWLSATTGQAYRLPSEAEWEYACRAGKGDGTGGTYCGGEDLGSVGWFRDNSGRETHPVGQKAANGWGLHDMSGNLAEWTADCAHYPGYAGAPADGSAWEGESCAWRMARGGAFVSSAEDSRAAWRYAATAVLREDHIGFRLARTLP